MSKHTKSMTLHLTATDCYTERHVQVQMRLTQQHAKGHQETANESPATEKR